MLKSPQELQDGVMAWGDAFLLQSENILIWPRLIQVWNAEPSFLKIKNSLLLFTKIGAFFRNSKPNYSFNFTQ